MNIADLSKLQVLADEKRGFPVRFARDQEKIEQITKDLVGLLGEIGEFANLIKKVDLKTTRPTYNGPTLSEARASLQEELADSVIYILRISEILDTKLENEILKKFDVNKQRYKSLESE